MSARSVASTLHRLKHRAIRAVKQLYVLTPEARGHHHCTCSEYAADVRANTQFARPAKF